MDSQILLLTSSSAQGMNIEKMPTLGHDADKYMTLSIGPQHHGSGHMRIIVVVDGDSDTEL